MVTIFTWCSPKCDTQLRGRLRRIPSRGTGPTDLLVIFADVTHIEHGWREPATLGFSAVSPTPCGWSDSTSEGSNLPDPLAGRPTLADRMGEITSVLDAVGSEQVAVFGIWEGAHMAIRYAVDHPNG